MVSRSGKMDLCTKGSSKTTNVLEKVYWFVQREMGTLEIEWGTRQMEKVFIFTEMAQCIYFP